MPHKIKEEERIEKIIRGLLKLPENKRCINCNLLGPQYVCTTFWTFVCTNCSGVHREFTHRVKSVSMAKFSAEEVSCLQAGGNERAREIYFKAWDPQHNSLPDGSNLSRLREFIKHVYVERRFTGERSLDNLAMVKTDFKDGFYEKRSYDRYGSASFDRSITRGGHESRNLRNFLEVTSPRDKKNGGPGGRRSQPTALFEIVDDRFREDSYGNMKRYEIHRHSSSQHRGGSLSPGALRSKSITVPEVRSVKEILGDTVPRLKVGEAANEKGGRDSDSTLPEKTAQSSSPAPAAGRQVEQKTEKSSSLIEANANADAEPEHPDASESSKAQEEAPSTDNENSLSQAQREETAVEKATPRPKKNSVEFLMLELLSPVNLPASSVSEVPNNVDSSSATPAASSTNATASETAPNLANILALPSNSGDSSSEVMEGQQHLPETQKHQPSASPGLSSSSIAQPSIVESSSNQHAFPPAPNSQAQASPDQLSTSSPVTNSQEQDSCNQLSWPSPVSDSQAQNSANQAPNVQPASTSQPNPSSQTATSSAVPTSNSATEQSSQVASKQPQRTSSADASKPTARKELPADIFAALYPSYPSAVPYGQFRPAQGMGMGMTMGTGMAMGTGMGMGLQYNPNAVPAHGPSHTSKSRNPFDVGDDAPQAQNPMFSAMASLQLSAQMGLRPQSSPYAVAMHPQQSLPYGMAILPGAHAGREIPSNMQVSSPMEDGNSNSIDAAFALLNPLQSKPRSPAPTTAHSNPPGRGGNPFG